MDTKISTNSEIVVTTKDGPGVLSKISSTVANAGINIKAICGYATDDTGHVRLITDNNARAIEILNGSGFKSTEHKVIVSELAPHYLHPEVSEFAGTFEVENNYWCAATHTGEHAMLIFSPTENIKAAGLR